MHVKSKQIAFLGVLMALTVIVVVLSGIIELNTFFLLSLASFSTGIAIYEVGLALGGGFLVGSVFLSFLLAPNKLYVVTYAGIGCYVLCIEAIWKRWFWQCDTKKYRYLLVGIKVIIFNVMYLPMLIWIPDVLMGIPMNRELFFVLAVLGQGILFVYDQAYRFFIQRYWVKISRRI